MDSVSHLPGVVTETQTALMAVMKLAVVSCSLQPCIPAVQTYFSPILLRTAGPYHAEERLGNATRCAVCHTHAIVCALVFGCMYRYTEVIFL